VMEDRFDYETYWWILERVGGAPRARRFCDVGGEGEAPPFFILRHDVDYDPAPALRLARLEADRGFRATYFLLLNSVYYNLLGPEHAAFPRQLVEMGHEVGLHYDLDFLAAFPRGTWDEWLDTQASLMGRLSGTPVATIALHQPGLQGPDPFKGRTRFRNAYDDNFFRDMAYVSDSCRAWRDAAWEMLASGRIPPRLQLALHPLNWSVEDRDRRRIFASVHADRQAAIARAGDELLARIEAHGGVLEHEARPKARVSTR
jgi:hypothetical protein